MLRALTHFARIQEDKNPRFFFLGYYSKKRTQTHLPAWHAPAGRIDDGLFVHGGPFRDSRQPGVVAEPRRGAGVRLA